ncbi:hypothetical protein BC832DRAFT_129438 [Gaertneriomyces semiglobifer]|nr:hypothetical protein BC832DRAFT_129438 [Gaertneriomyces semiglobifer]
MSETSSAISTLVSGVHVSTENAEASNRPQWEDETYGSIPTRHKISPVAGTEQGTVEECQMSDTRSDALADEKVSAGLPDTAVEARETLMKEETGPDGVADTVNDDTRNSVDYATIGAEGGATLEEASAISAVNEEASGASAAEPTVPLTTVTSPDSEGSSCPEDALPSAPSDSDITPEGYLTVITAHPPPRLSEESIGVKSTMTHSSSKAVVDGGDHSHDGSSPPSSPDELHFLDSTPLSSFIPPSHARALSWPRARPPSTNLKRRRPSAAEFETLDRKARRLESLVKRRKDLDDVWVQKGDSEGSIPESVNSQENSDVLSGILEDDVRPMDVEPDPSPPSTCTSGDSPSLRKTTNPKKQLRLMDRILRCLTVCPRFGKTTSRRASFSSTPSSHHRRSPSPLRSKSLDVRRVSSTRVSRDRPSLEPTPSLEQFLKSQAVPVTFCPYCSRLTLNELNVCSLCHRSSSSSESQVEESIPEWSNGERFEGLRLSMSSTNTTMTAITHAATVQTTQSTQGPSTHEPTDYPSENRKALAPMRMFQRFWTALRPWKVRLHAPHLRIVELISQYIKPLSNEEKAKALGRMQNVWRGVQEEDERRSGEDTGIGSFGSNYIPSTPPHIELDLGIEDMDDDEPAAPVAPVAPPLWHLSAPDSVVSGCSRTESDSGSLEMLKTPALRRLYRDMLNPDVDLGVMVEKWFWEEVGGKRTT